MSSKIVTALKTVDYKDVAVRSLWTFVQAFLAVVLVASDVIIDKLFTADWEGLRAVIIATAIAGLAAGISALKTVIVGVAQDIKLRSE